ncbi:MAG: heat shock protein HspQ [Planctomycetota bacterium]
MIRLANTEPKFAPGELVRHLRYGYRGVVVAADRRCEASNEWYSRNRTQPDQQQPWYHVLVDESAGVTYVAESNLEADSVGAEITHPLLDDFFEGYSGDGYLRNDRPWHGW